MAASTKYRLDVLPHNKGDISTRLFTSNSVSDMVIAMLWMIEQIPSPMTQAEVRVALMLSLRNEK